MSSDPSGLWWTLTLINSAVGAGIFIYGWRQREGRSLLCGVALSALPMVGVSDISYLALSVLIIAAYVAAMKYL